MSHFCLFISYISILGIEAIQRTRPIDSCRRRRRAK